MENECMEKEKERENEKEKMTGGMLKVPMKIRKQTVECLMENDSQ